MELFGNIVICTFMVGCFLVLIAGIYMSCNKLAPVESTEITSAVEPDPFEFEFEWSPTVRKGYLLDHVPNV